MKALYYDGSGGLEWREDPTPVIEDASDALVRPIAVSTCDLDQAIIHGSVPGSEQPFAIGHEGVGEVVEVGGAVDQVQPGDLVAIPYHVSCGACDRCTDELPLFCRASAADALALYGIPIGRDYGGLFSELVRVPFADHSLLKLPPNVSPLQAVSVGDNLTDAWRVIAPHLDRQPGADVLIMSTGSAGLYAADIARACGAGLVHFVDRDTARLELAARLGAETSTLEDFSPDGREYPITLNASDSRTALRNALWPPRQEGTARVWPSTFATSSCRCSRCTSSASTSALRSPTRARTCLLCSSCSRAAPSTRRWWQPGCCRSTRRLRLCRAPGSSLFSCVRRWQSPSDLVKRVDEAGVELGQGSAPTIDELVLADEPECWAALGFTVLAGCCQLGTVRVRLAGREAGQGILSWSLRAIASVELDGLPTTLSQSPLPGAAPAHSNGVLAIDHVVAMTPRARSQCPRVPGGRVGFAQDPRAADHPPDVAAHQTTPARRCRHRPIRLGSSPRFAA